MWIKRKINASRVGLVNLDHHHTVYIEQEHPNDGKRWFVNAVGVGDGAGIAMLTFCDSQVEAEAVLERIADALGRGDTLLGLTQPDALHLLDAE